LAEEEEGGEAQGMKTTWGSDDTKAWADDLRGAPVVGVRPVLYTHLDQVYAHQRRQRLRAEQMAAGSRQEEWR